MREWCAAAAAMALLTTQALAADSGPLAPGKPAGTVKAQTHDDNTILYILGAGAIIGGIVLLSSSNNSSTPNPGGGGSSTTTT